MTIDDAFKAVATAALAALSAVAAWLARRVVESHDKIMSLEGRATALESAAGKQLTLEDVRRMLEAALDRRDTLAEQRREEWDRRLSLEIRQAVREACDRGCPHRHEATRGEHV